MDKSQIRAEICAFQLNTFEALPFDITFDDTPVKSVSDIKFLGITLDDIACP